jgi:hypothetical protein
MHSRDHTLIENRAGRVRILLKRVRDRLHFVTVPELLRRGRPQKEIWYKEANLELLNKLRGRGVPAERSSRYKKQLVGELAPRLVKMRAGARCNKRQCS